MLWNELNERLRPSPKYAEQNVSSKVREKAIRGIRTKKIKN